MNANRKTARTLWASVGALALAVAALGTYYSLRPAAKNEPARAPAPGEFAFRIYDGPRALPELPFDDAQGRKRSLSQFAGKVVLLNVWATWCAPCREEMAALDRLQQKLGGPRFEVIALSIDSAGAPAVRRFYEEVGVRALEIYVDPSMQATGRLGIVGVPTTLLIDRHGLEIGRRTGPAEWDGPQAVRMLEHYLEKESKA